MYSLFVVFSNAPLVYLNFDLICVQAEFKALADEDKVRFERQSEEFEKTGAYTKEELEGGMSYGLFFCISLSLFLFVFYFLFTLYRFQSLPS